MDCAALRPAPIAEMTVAPPVTISPPANTPGMDVSSVSGFTASVCLEENSSPGVFLSKGFVLLPIAITALCISIVVSLPSSGTGRRLPDASGSPNVIR